VLIKTSPRATGYATWTGDGPVVEADTYRCWHCGNVEFLKPKEPPAGHCLMCQRPICARCAAQGSCTPFEKQLDQMEARDRLRRQIDGLYR
jgi:hypothetical protein